MSTRSTITFYSDYGNNEPLLHIYQQCDGYLEGVGLELAEWLKNKKIINGIGDERMEAGFANGMGCLAAQFVAAHKTGIGSFYTTTAETKCDYNYEVRLIDGRLIIKVDDFEGTPEEFITHLQTV